MSAITPSSLPVHAPPAVAGARAGALHLTAAGAGS